MLFLVLLSIESMFIQTKVASILLNVFSIFHIHWVLSFSLPLCTIFVILSNAKLFTKMAIMQTVLMFSTMIIIPIYFCARWHYPCIRWNPLISPVLAIL